MICFKNKEESIMGLREQVVAEGMKWKGKLYYSQQVRYDFRDGGSADCSSFFQHCLQVGAGVDPGYNTDNQRLHGRKITQAELLPGDGIFYPGHVELYIGNGEVLNQGGPDWDDMGPRQQAARFGDAIEFRTYIDEGASSSEYTFYPPEVKRGDNGVAVLLAQEILVARQLLKSGLTWTFNADTEAAVRLYQGFRNFEVNGRVDRTTWDDMLSMDRDGNNYIAHTCSLGDVNSSVLLVQEILFARGYYTGECDMSYGAATEAAVRQYQSDRAGAAGEVDGVTGPKTWADLIAL